MTRVIHVDFNKKTRVIVSQCIDRVQAYKYEFIGSILKPKKSLEEKKIDEKETISDN